MNGVDLVIFFFLFVGTVFSIWSASKIMKFRLRNLKPALMDSAITTIVLFMIFALVKDYLALLLAVPLLILLMHYLHKMNWKASVSLGVVVSIVLFFGMAIVYLVLFILGAFKNP